MSEEIDHLHMSVRGLLVRGVVQAIDDTGAVQVVTTQTHFGRVRSRVPVHQPFGFASHAPLDGAVTHVVSVGGDPADQVALPPANPQVARFGDLPEGDTVAYDACGQRLHFHNGTLVEVQATTELRVGIGGTTVLDVTAKGVAIIGSLTVSEGITAQGDVVGKNVSLAAHIHPINGSVTGEPEAS